MSDGKHSVEDVKIHSRALRGTVNEELKKDTDHFEKDDTVVLKHHGIYQQDNRDARKTRTAGEGKAYSFMIRCKIPAGGLTGPQYLALDGIAERWSDGSLRFTTRQCIQFHGVLKNELRTSMQTMNQALVTTLGACGDVVRNFMACPAPLPNRTNSCIHSCANELTARLLPRTKAYHEVWLDGERVETGAPKQHEEPFYGDTYLPRKFKVGIAFPGDNCVDVYSQDIGIVPLLHDGVGTLDGFILLVGGGLGKTHGKDETYPLVAQPLGTIDPGSLGRAVEAIVAVQRDHGNRTDRRRARMKYLIEEWGLPRFREAVEQQFGRRLGRLPAEPLSWTSTSDHLGWHRQADGRWFYGVWVENGRVRDSESARPRSAFRALINRLHLNVRLTPQQNILFTDIPADRRSEVESILGDHGIAPVEALPLVRRNAMACPAIPTCGLAVAEAERVLPNVVRQIEAIASELGLEGEQFSTRMSGCPNGCSRPYLGDLGFVGRTLNKYQVYIGGDFAGTRLGTVYADMVPLDRLAETVRPLLVAYRDGRQPGEGFGDFCHRLGVDRLPRFERTK
jgi:sulfite reductase (ferredoxin)